VTEDGSGPGIRSRPFGGGREMVKKGVGRPRDGNPEETRRYILEAAERAFASAGFAGATTRQVASAAGVNVATLHYHFGSKEGLYRAVLREAVGGPLPSVPGPGEPADRLRAVVSALFDHAASRRSLSRLALLDRLAGPRRAPETTGPDEPRAADDEAGSTPDPRVPLVAEALAGGLDGDPESPGVGFLARWIVGMIDVSCLSTEAGDGGHPAPAVRDAVVEAALSAFGATSPRGSRLNRG